MVVKIGVNGAGGIIGAALTHELDRMKSKGLEVVALNDPIGAMALAEKHRGISFSKKLDWRITSYSNEEVLLGGKPVRVYRETDASKIPWKEHGVKIVGECSGFYTEEAKARQHLGNGVEKVVISAPAKGENVKTLIMGANHTSYIPYQDEVISNASCTTKAIAMPLAMMLNRGFDVRSVQMVTAHAATGKQPILDSLDNLVLSTTGAAVATEDVLGALKGNMDGFAVRSPNSDGSLAIMSVVASYSEGLDVQELNDLFREEFRRVGYCGRIGYDGSDDVSTKMNVVGRKENSIIFPAWTKVNRFGMNGTEGYQIFITAGYDNELAPPRDQAMLMDYIAMRENYE